MNLRSVSRSLPHGTSAASRINEAHGETIPGQCEGGRPSAGAREAERAQAPKDLRAPTDAATLAVGGAATPPAVTLVQGACLVLRPNKGKQGAAREPGPGGVRRSAAA